MDMELFLEYQPDQLGIRVFPNKQSLHIRDDASLIHYQAIAPIFGDRLLSQKVQQANQDLYHVALSPAIVYDRPALTSSQISNASSSGTKEEPIAIENGEEETEQKTEGDYSQKAKEVIRELDDVIDSHSHENVEVEQVDEVTPEITTEETEQIEDAAKKEEEEVKTVEDEMPEIQEEEEVPKVDIGFESYQTQQQDDPSEAEQETKVQTDETDLVEPEKQIQIEYSEPEPIICPPALPPPPIEPAVDYETVEEDEPDATDIGTKEETETSQVLKTVDSDTEPTEPQRQVMFSQQEETKIETPPNEQIETNGHSVDSSNVAQELRSPSPYVSEQTTKVVFRHVEPPTAEPEMTTDLVRELKLVSRRVSEPDAVRQEKLRLEAEKEEKVQSCFATDRKWVLLKAASEIKELQTKYTAEYFLPDIPWRFSTSGKQIPSWKRFLMAQKKADKHIEDEETRIRIELREWKENQKSTDPDWKRQLKDRRVSSPAK